MSGVYRSLQAAFGFGGFFESGVLYGGQCYGAAVAALVLGVAVAVCFGSMADELEEMNGGGDGDG